MPITMNRRSPSTSLAMTLINNRYAPSFLPSKINTQITISTRLLARSIDWMCTENYSFKRGTQFWEGTKG